MTKFLVSFLILALTISARSSSVSPVKIHSGADDSASTLAFVFDVTGSMYDDLKQVIEGASRILERTLSRRTRPIKNFVLVPFHDPDIGPVSITTDPKKFQKDLQELFVQGGGDCPEMSIGAIKKALEVSLPGSFIYVFTDARAKDYRLKRDVLQLVQLRQSQVVFVLTGDCGDRSQPGYRAYEEIAATSSGQIFHLDKQQVNEVLKWVEETVQAMKVHLLSSDHETAQESQWEVPFDPSLKEVTVSLSGPAPQIELRDPLGRIVGERQGLTELLNIPNSARVVNLKNPRPGPWTLKVGCSGRHTLRVTGVSNLDFRAGFSSIPVTEFSRTRERPIKGVPAHVMLKCSGLKPPGLVTNMELVSLGGRSLRTIPVPLPGDGGSGGIWRIPEFRTPSQSFFLKMSGNDGDGYNFQRLSSVSYTNIIPEPPRVSMPTVVRGFYMQPATIDCSVDSDLPYKLRFTRGGSTIGEERTYESPVKASWEIPHASGSDEGAYECVAQSTAGMGRALTQLTVREPPPVLHSPVNVTSFPGAVVVLSCQVQGFVRHNLTWYRSGTALSSRSGRVRVLANSSLEISWVRSQDAGPYQCRATNAHGESQAVVWLVVLEAPSVVVSPQTQSFSLGTEVRISCSASGSPPPKVFWSHGNILLSNHHRMSISESGTLVIRGAAPEDAGNYTCLATNEAGTASQSVTISYAEPPSISVVQQVVMVIAGEDANLECQASGTPSPLVKWRKGDLDLGTVPFAEQDVHRGTLRIRGVQDLDSGDYTCVASNVAGSAAAVVILQVGAAPTFSESPVDITASVGDNITLPCVARGFPTPSLTWRRQDGRPIFGKSSGHVGTSQLPSGALQIQSVWVDDEGVYVCEAKNQFGSIKALARVTVTGLEPPLLVQGAPAVTVMIGQPLNLPCMLLDGIPLPERVWTHNGKQVRVGGRVFLRSDGSLHVDRAGADDAGTYVCTAINVAGSANITVTVEIHAPPDIKAGPLHYTANEGTPISLSCEASGVPKPTIVWTKGRDPSNRPVSSPLEAADGSLYIPSPTAEDAGVYLCTATSAVGYTSREMHLSVNSKPRIVGAEGSRTTVKMAAEVGSEVILPCEVNGSPAPLVTWSRNGQPIPPVTAWFTILPSGSLKISDARLIDSKFYTCSAANPAGNVSLTYNLQVQAKPRIQPAPTSLKALIGQTVVLPCVVQGEPSPQISWLHNGLLVGSDRMMKIQAVQHSDSGTYRCVASNSAGEDTIEIVLNILEGPYFETNGETIIESVANSRVLIPCPARGSPAPWMRWFKNGLEIQMERTEHGVSLAENGSLVIGSALASHSGDYKCVATNEAGSVERKTRLKVNVPPEIQDDGQPLNLTVTLKQPLTLGCDAFGIPTPTITWTKDNRPVLETPGVYLQNGKRLLKIYRVQHDHAGHFTCTAQNSAGEARREYTIEVQAPPVISGTSGVQELSVMTGQEVDMQCRVSGRPLPTVEWSHDGEVLSPNGDPHVEFLEKGQVLRVKSVRPRDRGLYQCVASNNAGTQTRQFRLNVQAAPMIRDAGENSEVTAVLGFPAVLISPDGSTLTFLNISPEDSGTYTCLAVSSAGQESKLYTLFVLVPPLISGETSVPREVHTTQHSVVTLECKATGTPQPQISWLRDGHPLLLSPRVRLLSADTLLRIAPVQLSDSGIYTCVARSRAGSAELNFDLQVQAPPAVERTEPTEQVAVVQGSSVTLTCEARGVPPPTLSWLKDGQPLSLHRNLLLDGQETRFLLSDVGPSDGGLYSCVASNQAGSSTKTFNLTVLEPPKISGSSSPEEQLIAVDSVLELECIATGFPPPTLSWLKDGRPLQDSMAVIEREGQLLRINKVQVDDAGLYTCLASSPAGEDGRNHWVRIQLPPTLLGSNDIRTVSVPAKGHLTLECQTDSDPPPEIEWYKDDVKLQLGGRIQSIGGGQYLEIQDVRTQDSGQYSCVVTNIAGSTSLFFTVEILLPPVIREGSALIVAHVNQDAVLPCEVEGGPSSSVLWRKDGGPVPLHNGRFTLLSEGSLRIASVQLSDAGRYYCSVSNQAGSDHRGMDLKVYVGPSISPGPFNVTVVTGQRAVLSCESTGIPAPQVSWKRNGSPLNVDLQSGSYRLMSSGSLIIASPSVEDEGYFECTVTNEVGEERRVIEVILQVPPVIEDDVSSVTAVKMSPVVLPCHATGRPEPVISWNKNWMQLGARGGSYRVLPTGALEILAATPSHAGKYTCSARNSVGAAYKHVTLTVQEPPEIRPMAEEVQVVLHHSVVLPCEVQGFPRPTITWQREGVPVATGHRLTVLSNGALKFSRVTLGDAGTYQCLAQNEAGTAMGRTNLILQVPPVLSVPRLEYIAVLGQPVSLECAADGQPKPEVTWHRERRPVVEGAHLRLFSNGTLHITSTQRSDAGIYTCSARNNVGRASHDLRLILQTPPQISAGQSEMSVIQGFQALLPCPAQGLPEPRVSWEKQGVPVSSLPGKFTLLRSGELIIERAEPGDAGLFTCVATNTAGTAQRDIRLSVNMRPAFKELPGDVTLNKGQSLTLSCHAQGTPPPTITWTANNRPYRGAGVDGSGRSSVIIDNVTVSDSGTYVCIAENTVGSIRALSFVRVREPPMLRGEAHTSQTVAQGRAAMLDCAVSGDPVPSLRWHKDGQPILGSLRFHPLRNGSLALYSATIGDSGEYRCVAESEAGAAERTISLKVQVPGGYSNWEEWGPCSVSCGQGIQERIRFCNNPPPANGGPSCEGPNVDSRNCQASLCPGESPRRARGSLIGMINEKEFGVAFLEANITENEEDGTSTLEAHVENIPPSVGPLLRVLVSVFAPIYWTTVYQSPETQNGFSLTHGQFRQESQLEFDTGEVLKLTHVARGLDAEGALLVDIVINGFVPPMLLTSNLNLQEFDESYVQTGSGQLYSWSSQNHMWDGAPLTLRCNHSVVFEGPEIRQGPLLQLLRLTGISSTYSFFTLSLEFKMTASLLIPEGDGETCPKGFLLDTASYCADEDECAVDSPCSHSCNNIMGGFSCACPSGFTISTESNTCQDIDECTQGSHLCHPNQQCVNTVGTYRCQAKCGLGFKPSLVGTSCEDVDECQESAVSPCQQQCFNTLGSYRCTCHQGYQLVGHRCLDINECLRNVCPAHQQCRNTDGGYQCFDSCPSGMTTAENGVCVDIDECQDGSHMCRYSQICQNTVGGYGCVCPRGYRSQGVGRPCLDIDECAQVPSPCAFQCRNVPGSFRCLCPPGTVLLGDGRSCAGLERGHIFTNSTRVQARLRPQLVSTLERPYLTRLSVLPEHLGSSRRPRHECPVGYTSKDGTCIDIDECAFRKPCQHECRNTIGSYQCTCPPGYQLLSNGRTCKDIDECSVQGVQCGPNQMCFNTRGGYQCLDTPCPTSYQRGRNPGTCYRPCTSRLDCGSTGFPLLQYKLLTLPLGIPAHHNVARLSAFSESGVLQDHTSFTILEQGGENGERPFGIKDEAGRGIIFTVKPLDWPGLVRLRVQATTLSDQGRITYQSIFIIYISISKYPY
ncbi:hemicentin-1 [Garra rufa]|uniref:hemicentin-1 n=1 Tax=Garra rufa TaxID=137080 RepID=UPI003CCEAD36